MAIKDTLFIIAPEFENIPNEKIDAVIAIAENQVSTKFCDRNTAIAYLAAHILTVSGRRGVGGVVASEREGDLARSFTAIGSHPLDSTAYGLEYRRLVRQCFLLPRNRVV